MALKLWNGHVSRYPGGRAYVCAKSQDDAVALIRVCLHQRTTKHELKKYWSDGCWGNQMDGITPERGVWLSTDRNCKPLRLWVPEIGGE